MYEIFAKLLEERDLKAADVSRGTGLPSSLFSEWKRGKSTPKSDKMQKIADFLGVTLYYLMYGVEEPKYTETVKASRDVRDIAEDINSLLEKLTTGKDGPALYDGQPLTDESVEILREDLEISLRRLKLINKSNPNKY